MRGKVEEEEERLLPLDNENPNTTPSILLAANQRYGKGIIWLAEFLIPIGGNKTLTLNPVHFLQRPQSLPIFGHDQITNFEEP